VNAYNVFLSGGPTDIPQRQRLIHLADVTADDDVVVPKGNGYEHFSSTNEICEIDGSRLTVFRWQYNTRIAE
jgi:hypothetical protein